ncbi:MAG: FadR/GntR family transcriptional regulator [Firmicutes bacterium]|nr:FadR/GntR family transcriptional regulator [Bacillota bacterium]MDY2808105.1 FadR/GntR family transcriptional regulator [Oscillospiraceae bacterium]
MALKTISKQNISDVIYEQLMENLIAGEWKPGDKIPSENELAAQLQVSRISVRSALQRLSSLGLVESRQGEGTFVCEFSGAQYANNLIPLVVFERSDMQDLMEFRNILDSEIAALAALRATDTDIALLHQNYQRHMAAEGDVTKCADYDSEFHCLLAAATHNALFHKVYQVFQPVFRKNMHQIVSIMGVSGARVNHAAILAAVEQHDPDAARAAMQTHVQETISSVWDHSDS